jgi:hypothetical protein
MVGLGSTKAVATQAHHSSATTEELRHEICDCRLCNITFSVGEEANPHTKVISKARLNSIWDK